MQVRGYFFTITVKDIFDDDKRNKKEKPLEKISQLDYTTKDRRKEKIL